MFLCLYIQEKIKYTEKIKIEYCANRQSKVFQEDFGRPWMKIQEATKHITKRRNFISSPKVSFIEENTTELWGHAPGVQKMHGRSPTVNPGVRRVLLREKTTFYGFLSCGFEEKTQFAKTRPIYCFYLLFYFILF